MAATGRHTRYRGLRFPPDDAILPSAVAGRLRDGTWQAAYTAAACALARPDDRAVVVGAGTGHIAALLAGKIGLPSVTVIERQPDRRAYLARLSRANGLARLTVFGEADIPALAPTLIFADLEAAPPPYGIADCLGLRAIALHLPPGAAPESVPAADIAAAGLCLRPDLSAGGARVFFHSSRAP